MLFRGRRKMRVEQKRREKDDLQKRREAPGVSHAISGYSEIITASIYIACVLGSVLSASHAFTHIILIRAHEGEAVITSILQMSTRGTKQSSSLPKVTQRVSAGAGLHAKAVGLWRA